METGYGNYGNRVWKSIVKEVKTLKLNKIVLNLNQKSLNLKRICIEIKVNLSIWSEFEFKIWAKLKNSSIKIKKAMKIIAL